MSRPVSCDSSSAAPPHSGRAAFTDFTASNVASVETDGGGAREGVMEIQGVQNPPTRRNVFFSQLGMMVVDRG